MEKQISIIIPTYNMEKYIGKCLDSLLTPEFEQVEVLVVNDGSKDRSSEIAHGYADRYSGSIRVIDKPNGNYGSCINAALPLATGRYVKVLDADDTFDTEAFSELVRMLADIDDDVVVTPFTVVDTDGNILVSQGFDTAKVNLNSTYRLAEYDGEFDDYRIQMHQ
ncbi:MAG: glycosyltransferase family 2 protein, partial [Muribaculaceae bacterium]|nr:glycosyltransferase family 2 protein [Muribaculaceae bacterium]